jgi:hypothetical protein
MGDDGTGGDGGQGQGPASDDTSTKGDETDQSQAQNQDKGDQQGQHSSEDQLKSALAEERRLHKETQGKLAKLEQKHMTEQEKAVAGARAEGRTEVLKTAGQRLAAAEFRAAAAGKLADPAAALDLVDLGRFVTDDGEVDTKKITEAVDKLVAALPAPTNGNGSGRIPAGARGGAGAGREDEWLRSSIDR